MNASMTSTDEAPSPDVLYQPGDILKLSYRVVAPTMEPFLPTTHRKPFSSYTIYCGRGRVIHVWSNTRTNFRVRVDTLRSLEATGLVVANVTPAMDAYCASVLGVSPLPQDTILPRARKALHCTTPNGSSSILLVLSARYGSIAMRMAKSFYAMIPHLAYRCDTEDMLVDRLGEVVRSLLAQQPVPDELADQARARASDSAWLQYSCELAAKALRGIKSLLICEVGRVLSMWVTLTFETTSQSPTSEQMAYGMVISRTDSPLASLVFNHIVQRFVMVFDSDKLLLERLARDRMECGICFVSLEKLRIKVFDCSHYTCGECLKKLQQRICPYCRAPIAAVREVTSYLKQQAFEIMRAAECKQLEEHDFDAPVFVPQLTSGGEDPASPGYDCDQDNDEDDAESVDLHPPVDSDAAPANDVRAAEAVAMLAEDINALAL